MGSGAWFVDLLHLVPAAKCRTPLRGVLGLVVLHLVPPSGVMVLYLVAVDNSPPFGGYYI